MEILKYKKLSNGKYKVTLNNLELILYEEVILKYNLLISKNIARDIIEDIMRDNTFYEVYYAALSLIKTRIRSTGEIYELLKKKEYSADLIENCIEKLSKQGYLNDDVFAKAFINSQMVSTYNGPNKIRNALINRGIDTNIIENNISVFSEEEQMVKIQKLVYRFLKSNKSRGGIILKRKITSDLINYGFDINLIDVVISNVDFKVDSDIARREYDKLYKKLCTKYSGDELKRKIREKMYLKGLEYEEN